VLQRNYHGCADASNAFAAAVVAGPMSQRQVTWKALLLPMLWGVFLGAGGDATAAGAYFDCCCCCCCL
jgi:hypothetical protein